MWQAMTSQLLNRDRKCHDTGGMDRRSISPGFVEDALACLRGQGIDAAPLLRQAGLPDPVTGPVSTDCYGRLWWLIAQAMQDEFFGLAARPMRRDTSRPLSGACRSESP